MTIRHHPQARYPHLCVEPGRIVCFMKLGQLVSTTWKRLLTLRVVAWSPVLVAGVIVWCVVNRRVHRRRVSSEVVRHPLQGW